MTNPISLRDPQREDPERDFAALTDKIARECDFRCSSYKDRCLRRRIAVRMRARGVHTYQDYMRLLDADTREYELLLDALTINVTKFFRNWDTFDAIGQHVIPALWGRPDPWLQLWSAGCASGEEAYSLAVLVHRYLAGRGQLHRILRVTIHGTDIDRSSLATAERACYPEAAFSDTPTELRRTYFSATEPATVDPRVKPLVRFARRDLLADPPPEPVIHLIVCRNVLIYFDRHAQEELLERFFGALAPGGFLVLGKVETLLGAARTRFTTVRASERIFRKAVS